MKGRLILAYKNLIAARAMPSNPATPPEVQSLNHNNNPNRQRVTTDWNVQRRLSTGDIEFSKPFNGDAYALIQAIETHIRQQLGKVSPKLTILAGRWWSPLSSNFTLTFTGRPTTATVLKYREALLHPFGLNIFELMPNKGQMRLVFQGVPIHHKSDGTLPTSKELCGELGHNLPY
jgi:hypothetical protein